MVRVVAILLCGLFGAAVYAAAPKSSKGKTVKTSSKKPSSSTTSSASKKKSSAKTKKPTAPPRQTQPTADRYREIQEALIAKGFLEGPATGHWDEKTVEAFKQFERSQNLNDDGKLDSLALIALGLGPKRSESLPQTELP
jgi:peptidoglycan hydrolase-like protein with peptidoglycan-binding domain